MRVDSKDPPGATDKGNLLRQLRIDPSDRDGLAPSASRSRKLYLALGFVAVTLAAAALAYWKWHPRPYTVEVATALAPSAAQGPTAILQASGYVT
ncbi:MAG TPA: hypothetical protein VGN77_00810, partial [Steroidobacteraceae bacterium]|nr:hypothetical protein [Steroidobacteraceae bacterium]